MESRPLRPIIFGEVLFDRFPDGKAVLGGAPFNVAWHLQGFGMSPLLVTAIGDDADGQQVLDRMQDWGMDVSAVQRNKIYPTGQVKVSFQSGEPSYDIMEDQAYDHINTDQASEAIKNAGECGMLYHGSLALRAEESEQTLQSIISKHCSSIFIDINLRPPWWTMRQVKKNLAAASWVKLNEEELSTIMQSEYSKDRNLSTLAHEFYTQYKVKLLIVTLGGDGAFLICQDGIVNADAEKVENIVDTVGAGDSFSAVMITGMLLGWPLELRLQRALEFAASVCQNQGATTADRAMYTDRAQRW